MKRIDLFPTEIWLKELNHIDNGDIAKLILKKEQEEPTVKTHLRYAVASAGGWQSEPNLHYSENTQLQNLLKSIGEVTDEIKNYNRFSKNTKTECQTMWASVNRYRDYHRLHVHRYCNYSGVYYVKTHENCGAIHFIDPRKEKRMLADNDLHDSIDDLSFNTVGVFSAEPKEGGLIIFPNFLEHHVEANQTHEPRISISFNIKFISSVNMPVKWDGSFHP